MLATLGLTNAASGQTPALVDFGGLLQRITVTIGFASPTALALRALTAMPPE